jgi:RNA polymerase sigma-70 factor, ECF subfamily
MTTTAVESDELAQAFAQNSTRLRARARRIVTDPHLAEEAVQEAFIRAWAAYDRFDPSRGPLLSWLLTITSNVAIDLARARGRRPAPASMVLDQRQVPQQRDVAEHIALRTQLAHALRQVSPQHREVVVEVVLRDRPPAEVAAELGINPATLRTRLHYALRGLRALLHAEECMA